MLKNFTRHSAGISGHINGDIWFAGHGTWVAKQIGAPQTQAPFAWGCRKTKQIYNLTLAETLKQETPQAIDALKQQFPHMVGISGDSKTNTQRIFEQLGITQYHAQQSPRDKQQHIQSTPGGHVAMMGDGINDLPAQQQAHCGIGYAHHGDQLDVVLANHSPWQTFQAKKLADQCVRAIHTSLIFSLAYNVAGIALAAGGFALLCGAMMNPAIAATLMLTSFCVLVLISKRLKYLKVPRFTPQTPSKKHTPTSTASRKYQEALNSHQPYETSPHTPTTPITRCT